MGAGAGGVKYDLRAGFEDRFDAIGAGGNARIPGPGEAIGVGVDASDQAEIHVVGAFEDFVHQVGADIAGAEYGDFDLIHGSAC